MRAGRQGAAAIWKGSLEGESRNRWFGWKSRAGRLRLRHGARKLSQDQKIEREELPGEPLELSGFPLAQLFPQEERDVEGRRVYQQPFENVVAASQMKPPHATGFVQVSKASLRKFTALLL